MQYSQEHLKTMVYAKFGGQTECIMGNSKIENEIYQGELSRGNIIGPLIRGKIRRVLNKTRTFRINGTFRLK